MPHDDELVSGVAVILQRVKNVKLGQSLDPIAREIVDFVRADMARQLLSDDALAFQERRNTYLFDKSLTYGGNVIEQNRLGMIAALAAIGITVEDDSNG